MLQLVTYIVIVITGLAILGQIHVVYYGQYFYHKLLTTPPSQDINYDFIVVGSGSSGSVVATRLAQGGHKVLLVESGGPSHWLQGIPSFHTHFVKTPYDWSFNVNVAPNGDSIQNNEMKWPRGKELGGSSMFNWMIYMRGHSRDYDEWQSLGNEGWGYKDVFPYFLKSEGFRGEVQDKEKYHNTKGELKIHPAIHEYPINDVFAEAFEELGYKFGDVNGADEDGAIMKKTQSTLDKGWRMGAYRSFVEPILGQENIDLTVLPFAHVTQLLFQDNSNKVKGVTLTRFGQSLTYRCDKEVIVSAGAIGSPQLLMLSGLGPKSHLESKNIQVKKDLAVGDNLQDHILVLFSFNTANMSLGTSPLVFSNPWNFYEFFTDGTGVLADTFLGTNGMIHTPISKNDKRPDLQIHTVPHGLDMDMGAGYWDMLNINKTSFDFLFGKDPGTSLNPMVLPTLLRPKSRGTIRLASSDPMQDPIIAPNYLSHPEDVRVLVEGLKFVHNLQVTWAFEKHNLLPTTSADTLHCGGHQALSDSYWECFARSWISTVFHPVGTCKMGPKKDKSAVVDARLRVHGIQGLRVADASIMPKIVGSNTHAPCVMIGEKAADMILQDWGSGLNKKGNSNKKDEL